MKRTIASLLAATVLAAAGAAAAQSLDDRIDRIEDRINHGVDEQALTPDQADSLRADLSRVRDLRDNLDSRGELTGWRRRDLQSRLDGISYRVSRDEYFGRYGSYRGYYRDWSPDGDEDRDRD